MFKVTREQQIRELIKRVPPVVNVCVVVAKEGRYLVGHKKGDTNRPEGYWLFPGGRMKFDETTYESANRILNSEIPNVKADLKKLITVISDKGIDLRSNNVSIYYLYNYISGYPVQNDQLDKFEWVDQEGFDKLHGRHPSEVAIFNEIAQAVRSMNTTEDEILVEIDKDDNEIGTIGKREAHSSPGRYHRAAWVFLFNSNGEVVLQQRGLGKAHNPGRWDMVGGHQIVGYTIEQTAHQELLEEVGVDTELTFFNKGIYKDEWQSEMHYVYWGIHDGPYNFDRNEVENVKSFDCKKLLSGLYSEYVVMDHVLKELYSMKSIWSNLIKNN